GLVLGDTPYAWRLLPFLASCAALGLMVPLGRRVLRPGVVPWALLLFATSDRLLWHSCEAKPYTVDVLAVTALLALVCRVRDWPLDRQLVLYAVLAPVLIFLSFPGCFLCGGLLVALLPAVWRVHRLRTWMAYGLLVLAVHGAFALLFLGPIRAQRCDNLVWFWADQLPNWERPWSIPGWSGARTFGVLRYCCKPTGGLLGVVALVGAIQLWRGRQRAFLCLLGMPIALALLGSYLRYYPYGHARVELYATPAVILLIALGLP